MDGRVSTDPSDCVWKTDIFGDEGTFHVAGAACRTMATSSSMTARAVLCGALAPTVASRATAPAASTGSSKCVSLQVYISISKFERSSELPDTCEYSNSTLVVH